MNKSPFFRSGMQMLLMGMLTLTSAAFAHAQTTLNRAQVTSTGQWLDARRAVYTGEPVLLHLRTGHERSLRMPEPVRSSGIDHQSIDFETDIVGDVVRFYPLSPFDRVSFHVIGLETGTDYELRVRASAFGIRQPLQLFLLD